MYRIHTSGLSLSLARSTKLISQRLPQGVISGICMNFPTKQYKTQLNFPIFWSDSIEILGTVENFLGR